MQCTKRNDYRRRVKNEREAASESALLGATDASTNGDHADADMLHATAKINGSAGRERDTEPAAKKARTSLAGPGNANGMANGGEDEEDELGAGEDEEDAELSDVEDDVDVDDEEEEDVGEEEPEDVVDVDGVERDLDDDDNDDEQGSDGE